MATNVCARSPALRAGALGPSLQRQQLTAARSFAPLLPPRQCRQRPPQKRALSTSLLPSSHLDGAQRHGFMGGANPLAWELSRVQARPRSVRPAAAGARASLLARWKTQWIREGNKPFPTMMEKPFFFWRILAVIPYFPSLFEGTLAVVYSGKFGSDVMNSVAPISTALEWYSKSPLIPMGVFFVLFFLIIQNQKMPHFVRWHTLQSILCEIILTIRVFVQQVLPPAYIIATFNESMYYLGFLVWFIAIYSATHAAFGMYSDIPFLSDAVYIQVPMGTQKAQEKDEDPED